MKAADLKLSLRELSQNELIHIIESSGVCKLINEHVIACCVVRRKILYLRTLHTSILREQKAIRHMRPPHKKYQARLRLNKKIRSYNNAADIVEQIFVKFPEIKEEFTK